MTEEYKRGWADGWNACRAYVLDKSDRTEPSEDVTNERT